MTTVTLAAHHGFRIGETLRRARVEARRRHTRQEHRLKTLRAVLERDEGEPNNHQGGHRILHTTCKTHLFQNEIQLLFHKELFGILE